MSDKDGCCSLAPYFNIHEGKVAEFKAGCELFMKATRNEPDCLYYAFSFDGNAAHCREGYTNADALLAHLDNVGALLGEALKISDLTRLEVHAPEAEMAKLREPLAGLNPQFFTLEGGFRR